MLITININTPKLLKYLYIMEKPKKKKKHNERANDYISRNYLSMLIAHKLNIDAVHNSTSNDIQILQNTQPNCHDPERNT